MRDRARSVLSAVAIAAGLTVLPAQAFAAIVLLQNDGFVDGASVGFQQGFAAGEQGAVTLGPVADSFQLNNVQLLFGPSGGAQTVTLRIFQDTGSPQPGPELFSGDFQLMPAPDSTQILDLSGEGLILGPGLFRVSIEFQHTGLPSIARDDDGTNTSGRNWINAQGIGWIASGTLGVSGDWIIRAEVNTMGGGSTTGATTGSGTGATTGSGAGGGGTGSGGASGSGSGMVCTPGSTQECVGPGACQGGQSCNADGTGFAPCECAGGAAEDGDGGGCSASSSTDPMPLAAFAGLLGLAAIARSRRKR